MDYENTFEMIDEPDYTAALITDADLGHLVFCCQRIGSSGLTRVNH